MLFNASGFPLINVDNKFCALYDRFKNTNKYDGSQTESAQVSLF